METVRPAGASRALLLLPHEMFARAAAIPAPPPLPAAETGRHHRVRNAPHEFYNGSARYVMGEFGGTPGSTSSVVAGLPETAAATTGGAEGFAMLHQMLRRAPFAAPHEFYDGSARYGTGEFGGAPSSTSAVLGLPETAAAPLGRATGAQGFVMPPHQMFGRVPETGQPGRVRLAPHEFFDGSAWYEGGGTPAPTSAVAGLQETAAALGQAAGAEGFVMPDQMFGRRVAGTGQPGRVRGSPHEFYDGSTWLESGGFGGAPASASAVVGLRETTVAAGDDDGRECAVCLEACVPGDALRTMPCAHGFHEACILEWLALSSLCPLCRFKLPTQEEEDAAASAADQAPRLG